MNSISRSTYSDPGVLQDLQSRVPLIHLHLQHGSNQLLEQENTKAHQFDASGCEACEDDEGIHHLGRLWHVVPVRQREF